MRQGCECERCGKGLEPVGKEFMENSKRGWGTKDFNDTDAKDSDLHHLVCNRVSTVLCL